MTTMTMTTTLRQDGRASSTTLRPLSCELSTLHNVTGGSAVWKQGATAVLAAVQGPAAPLRPDQVILLPNSSSSGSSSSGLVVTVLVKSGGTLSSAVERAYEVLLGDILGASCCQTSDEHGSGSILQVVLQVQAADGSVLAACLHAAVAALMDAGVAMRQLPTAVACVATTTSTTTTTATMASSNSNNSAASSNDEHPHRHLHLDPTAEEEEQVEASSVLTLIFGASSSPKANPSSSLSSSAAAASAGGAASSSLLACHTGAGRLDMDVTTWLQCCALAEKAVPAIVAFWRLAVEQKVARQEETLWAGASS